MNKKILAAAIASVFSISAAHAVVDLDADTGDVTFASELIDAADLNADGLLEAQNAGNILDVTAATGFTIGDGTSKYVRYNLTNAEFGAAPAVTSADANGNAALAQGGTVGDSYAIFEVSAAGGDLASANVLTMATAQLDISQTAAASVIFTLYETAADAVNETNALSSATGTVAQVASGSSGVFTSANTTTATVASAFKTFDTAPAHVASATLSAVGEIDNSLLLDGTTYTPAGAVAVATDFHTDAQDLTFSGNFSFGAWTLEDEADCNDVGGVGSIDVSAALNADENESTVAVASIDAGPFYLCADVAGLAANEVVMKGSYSVELVTDGLSGSIGTFVYDTTSIEVPYLTTFEGYNQRIYIVNYGSAAASYTMSFTSEDGVTATAGAAAAGSVPAGEMVTLKATDVVTLTGRTRTSAVIEVEAEDADISATTQTVNLSDGTTDTVVLN